MNFKIILKKVFFILAAAAVMGLSACSFSLNMTREKLPEDTVEELETAINNMDVNGMMDCMSEDMQDTVTAGLDIALGAVKAITGVSFDISAEKLIAATPLFQAMLGMSGYSELNDDMPHVDLQVTETYIKGNKATVYITEGESGDSMALNMEKEDGEWKLSLNLTPIDKEEADKVVIAGEETETEEAESGSFSAKGEFSLSDIIDIERISEVINGMLGGLLNR